MSVFIRDLSTMPVFSGSTGRTLPSRISHFGSSAPPLSFAVRACILGALALVVVDGIPALAQGKQDTVRPFVAPKMMRSRKADANDNGISDLLEGRIRAARKDTGRAEQDVSVIVTLFRPVRQADLEGARGRGAGIRHVWSHAVYGFSATLKPTQIQALAQGLGDALCLIEESRTCKAHLDVATRLTGVRNRVWPSYGFTGNSGIRIAILDTGVDDSHTDLSSRVVAWHDTSTDGYGSAVDYNGHGSHCAGIAAGTGAVHGAGAVTTITTTDTGVLPKFNGYGYLDRIAIPIGSGTLDLTMHWETGSRAVAYLLAKNAVGTSLATVTGDTSPLTRSYTIDQAGIWQPWSGNERKAGDRPYATLAAYPYQSVGDGYNLFSGVAPGSEIVGVKFVSGAEGSALESDMIEGMDWIIANRSTLSIKIASMSFGSSGVSTTMETAANNVVANGILFFISAGNDYPGATIGSAALGDKVVCVAATNDGNQITDYSSRGPSGSNKPDCAAPGGSYVSGREITSVDSNDSDGESTSFADRNANDYANFHGTSMACPYAAGVGALVVEALEAAGRTWTWAESDALAVKNLLLLTSVETNSTRENGDSVSLNRGSKDLDEGFGRICADAAVEAARYTQAVPDTVTGVSLGSGQMDRRCWARRVHLVDGNAYTFALAVPGGADFDLYLYEGVPDTLGDPVIAASSVAAGTGTDELISGFLPSATADYYLAVKWVSGTGTFTLALSSETVLGISVTPATWSLPGKALGAVCLSTADTRLAVQNTGSVAETMRLRISDEDDQNEWTHAATAGGAANNQYVLSALFCGVGDTPVGTNFNAGGSEDVVTTTGQTSTATVFGFAGASADGVSVAALQSVYLWLRLDLPTSVSGAHMTDAHTITMEVSCIQAE